MTISFTLSGNRSCINLARAMLFGEICTIFVLGKAIKSGRTINRNRDRSFKFSTLIDQSFARPNIDKYCVDGQIRG